MPSQQSCRNCKWFRVQPSADGRVSIRNTRAYNCDAPMPDIPALPDCITKTWGFTSLKNVTRRYVSPDEGKECPTHEWRDPKRAPKPLNVYGWTGRRAEAEGTHHQTREIVAARSAAAAARIAGVRRPSQLFCLSIAGNDRECAIARARPGTVFWCEIDASHRPAANWRAVEPRP